MIVGAGSAGCIVTNQIINNTNYKILLIEAGPSDNNPVIQVPLGYGMTFYNKKMNWNFYSLNQKNLHNYVEIYIKCNLKDIIKKGKKKLYKKKNKKSLYSFDIKSEFPKRPKILIHNNFKRNILEMTNSVLSKINKINELKGF